MNEMSLKDFQKKELRIHNKIFLIEEKAKRILNSFNEFLKKNKIKRKAKAKSESAKRFFQKRIKQFSERVNTVLETKKKFLIQLQIIMDLKYKFLNPS